MLRLFSNVLKQLCWRNFEGARQSHDIQKGYITLAAFDAANIISVQIGEFRQPLLGQFPL